MLRDRESFMDLGRVNGHDRLFMSQFVFHFDECFNNEIYFLGALQVDVFRVSANCFCTSSELYFSMKTHRFRRKCRYQNLL